MTTLVLDAPAADAGLDLDNFFLGRLASLVARQMAAVSPAERAALAQAAFSTLLDCIDLGLDDEARAIMAQIRAEPGGTLLS